MQKNIDTLGTMKMLKLISLETEKVELSPLTDTHLSDLFKAGSHNTQYIAPRSVVS